MAPLKARVVEVFASLQGEGTRVGQRQVFLRLAGCDRRCSYCDTPDSIGGPPALARIQQAPGGTSFEGRRNPLEGTELVAILERLGAPAPRPVVSLTGGEPLLQVDFLEAWLPPLTSRFAFVLETHGLLPTATARLLPFLEEVVGDLKLPSATGERVDWNLHRAFVTAVAGSPVALTLKAIVSGGTLPDELEQVFSLFELAGPRSALVLQPVTEFPGGPPTPTLDQLFAWQAEGLGRGLEVRVVPQVHKLMHVL